MYFVAVVLPKAVDEKVRHYKQQMKEAYGCKVGLKSPAHITIVPPFWMAQEREANLEADLSAIAAGRQPFLLRTANFSAFRPRTLFVAVEESIALQELKKSSDAFFAARDFPMKKENRPFHPHITIATRDLPKHAFFEVWPSFAEKKFEEEFAVTGLSLLKHNGRAWDVVFTADFAAPR